MTDTYCGWLFTVPQTCYALACLMPPCAPSCLVPCASSSCCYLCTKCPSLPMEILPALKDLVAVTEGILLWGVWWEVGNFILWVCSEVYVSRESGDPAEDWVWFCSVMLSPVGVWYSFPDIWNDDLCELGTILEPLCFSLLILKVRDSLPDSSSSEISWYFSFCTLFCISQIVCNDNILL